MSADAAAGVSLLLVLAGASSLAYLILSLFLSTLQSLGPVTIQRLLSSEPRLLRAFGPWVEDTPALLRVSLQIAHRTCYAAALLLLLTDLWARGFSPGRIVVSGVVAFAVLAALEQAAVKPLAMIDPERLFRAIVPALIGLHYALLVVSFPVYRIVHALSGRGRRAASDRSRPDAEIEQEIEAFIDVGEREGVVEKDEGAILKSALEFGDKVVREVMTPRVEMVAIERAATLAALRDLVTREKHSRVPVYRDNLDHIEGIIHIKDLIPLLGQGKEDVSLESLARPAHFVPESKRVSELLRDMQKGRQQMAIVVDEYGGTAGLVTIEDLLEEIVGEIADEHEAEDHIVREREGVYLVSGLADLDRVEELYDTHLSNGQYDTVGGLIFSALGRIPVEGEALEVGGIRMEVLDADRRRVFRVRLSPAGTPPAAGEIS